MLKHLLPKKWAKTITTDHVNIKPVFEDNFYHDGRGPELQKVHWKHNGAVLIGFEYFNPNDVYVPENLKHVILHNVEAFCMSSDEVHGNIVANGNTNAAIHEIIDSNWMATFNQRHLSNCKHYQIMFYDEIYDVVCEGLLFGSGKIKTKPGSHEGA